MKKRISLAIAGGLLVLTLGLSGCMDDAMSKPDTAAPKAAESAPASPATTPAEPAPATPPAK